MGFATDKNRTTAAAIVNAAPFAPDDSFDHSRIALPLPPTLSEDDRFEMEIYARFMRHLRHVPGTRMDIKILSAIQFTADMMDHGDALVAKILVDLGLRAPRRAFPVAYLDFVDKALYRAAVTHGTPGETITALREHWDHIGEDPSCCDLQNPYASLYEKDCLRA